MNKVARTFFAILLGSLLTCAVCFCIVAWSYPSDWGETVLGQKRQVVHECLGAPLVGDLWDVKADIWVEEGPFYAYRLELIYDTDTLCRDYVIRVQWGAQSTYHSLLLHSSF